MQIVKCISTIEEFSPVEFETLNIGVEIQEFVEPNLKDDEIENLVYEYEKLLKNFSHTKSLHGPFLDLKPASPDRDIRNISYKKYLRTLEIARELDMDYVIFHSQINPWLNEPYIKSLNNNQNKDFWHHILEDIKGFKGQIVLENIFEDDPLILKELIETIDFPNIRVCLDIGHAKLRTSKPLEKWVKELGQYVEYVHLHWNEGLYDEHVRPEDEDISYVKELLSKYNTNPIVALEYKVNDLKRETQRINRL
ncbi:sugar phosphate isomerase/epimerase family protein [Clostridium sp. Cult3]|uniref:sugar phosphate isomerase/epimerase family protein n=1 Tax=Clostridium sp. Cult3 TaxID=2079004 RepID=UPI001F36F547|nr:sugar phosphate isomerase/epimerase [Clostridium sp. Cult3]MCF6459839.1 hypothetical protein [Clostridium sp. Cult3]